MEWRFSSMVVFFCEMWGGRGIWMLERKGMGEMDGRV